MSNNNTVIIVESLNHARILNGLCRERVSVKSCKKELRRLTLTVASSDLEQAKKYFEEHSCNYVISEQKGPLHASKSFFSRYGLIAGIVVSFAAVIFMSMLVIDIDVSGLSEVSISAVEEVLIEHNIRQYSLKRNVDYNSLQQSLASIDGVASASVTVKGVRLLISIMEELPKGTVPVYDYDGLYAECDTIITKVVVQSGTAMVKAGDTVKAGELLIGAFNVLDDTRIIAVAARGEVYGRTWIKEEIVFESERIERIRTGKTKTVSELYICGQIVGKQASCPYTQADLMTHETDFGIVLPVKIKYFTYYETADQPVTRSFEAERDRLIVEKENEIEQKISAGKTILRKWNITKNIDKLYIISIYYELEGRVDARIRKEN